MCIGKDAHVDLRMSRDETMQPRHQPLRRQRGGDSDLEGDSVLFGSQALDRLAQAIEALLQLGQTEPCPVRQFQNAIAAVEQLYPQVFFQTLDLMADGRRRDVELLRGFLKAQMPGGGLKGPQSVKRRQT